MRATIDKAGRVVIPLALRNQAGLSPGTELEVTAEGFTIRLERAAPGPELKRRGRRLVVKARVPAGERPEIDVAALITEERDR